MRLINTETLELHSFPNEEDRPAYSILSHTWADEELTYQEMCEVIEFKKTKGQNKSAIAKIRRKQGWQKLERFCNVVALRGFGWAWMDTCCIDKTSLTELSEAINSMWKWYKGSLLCIAHLSDVDTATVFDGEHPNRFTNSRWFTRGWTLQELMAPSSLYFYDRNWILLGEKGHLKELIAHATDIARGFLDEVHRASTAQKFSWASKRTTTRVEDAAYCLMGLFGINMPLIYGEGYQRAFKRLQLEIIQSSSDQSIFVWQDNRLTPLVHHKRHILSDSMEHFGGAYNVFLTFYTPYAMTNIGLQIKTVLFTPAQVVSDQLEDFQHRLDLYSDKYKACFLMPLNCERRVAEDRYHFYLVILPLLDFDLGIRWDEYDVYVKLGLWAGPKPPPAEKSDVQTIYLHDGLQTFYPIFIPPQNLDYDLSSLRPANETYESVRQKLQSSSGSGSRK